MIKIIAGGKKHSNWAMEAISEYEKRLKKPFDLTWNFMPEDKLDKYLSDWPFSGNQYVIICDERGANISSEEFSSKLSSAFLANREVIILIGGAYGFNEEVRQKSDFVWSFSKLVFPHMIARLVVTEQIYRASQILVGGPYHHA